jgi:hypothetical protein
MRKPSRSPALVPLERMWMEVAKLESDPTGPRRALRSGCGNSITDFASNDPGACRETHRQAHLSQPEPFAGTISSRHSSPEVRESMVIGDNPRASTPRAWGCPAHKLPANRHLSMRDRREERPHRTQEVGGSSPPSSIIHPFAGLLSLCSPRLPPATAISDRYRRASSARRDFSCSWPLLGTRERGGQQAPEIQMTPGASHPPPVKARAGGASLISIDTASTGQLAR